MIMIFMVLEVNYEIKTIPKKQKENMYGNINSINVDPQMYECSCAICDCACSCGFCISTEGEFEKEISELEVISTD